MSYGVPWFSLTLWLVVGIEHGARAPKCVVCRLTLIGYRVWCGCHEICCLKEGVDEFTRFFEATADDRSERALIHSLSGKVGYIWSAVNKR